MCGGKDRRLAGPGTDWYKVKLQHTGRCWAGAALILPGTALAHHSYAALHVTCCVLQCYGATERPGACAEVYIAAVRSRYLGSAAHETRDWCCQVVTPGGEQSKHCL